jgi:hypothetical protein
MFRRFLLFAIFFLIVGPPVSADSLTDIRRACIERGNFHKGIHWLEECIQEMFTAEPVHVTMTTVAPGAGIAAFGPGFGRDVRIKHFDFLLLGSAAVSSDGSYVGAAQVTFAVPAYSLFGLHEDSRSARQKFGLRETERRAGEDPLDTKMSITMGYRRFDAREQNFYGIGPDSTLSSLASYGLILNDTYVRVDDPISSWNSVGLNFSFLQPRVTSSIDTSVPKLRTSYTESTAPGMNSHDNFFRFEPYAFFRIPPYRSFYTTIRVGYAIYHDQENDSFSFQRLTAVASASIPLWIPSQGTPSHRNWFLNFVCPSLRSATRCSLGNLTLNGNVAASYKGVGSQVPFFFDQTLGGTSLNGDDTLRGFADYRFRAPNSLLFQAEYRHSIWGPFGLLSFYDTGKVATLPSDLSLDHLRHDIGVGGFVRIGNREVLRVYIGFGTGEGSHAKVKVPVSF